jgi:hypothetical protein
MDRSFGPTVVGTKAIVSGPKHTYDNTSFNFDSDSEKLARSGKPGVAPKPTDMSGWPAHGVEDPQGWKGGKPMNDFNRADSPVFVVDDWSQGTRNNLGAEGNLTPESLRLKRWTNPLMALRGRRLLEAVMYHLVHRSQLQSHVLVVLMSSEVVWETMEAHTSLVPSPGQEN